MVNEGESSQGGHELNFGRPPEGPGQPVAPPAAPPPVHEQASEPYGAQPGQPHQEQPGQPQFWAAPGQQYPGQPQYAGQPAGPQPGQPQYAGQPVGPYPGQPPYAGQSGPPYPGQAYPGQPGPPYPGQPGPPYPGQAGPPYPGQVLPAQPGTPKKSSKGLLWGLIGGGAAVLLAIILVVALLVVPALTRSSATATDAVKGYLTAVSKGDAKAALGYLEAVPDKSLLTDSVLAASGKLAPISHISVREGKGDRYTNIVAATFAVGDRTVSTTYDVYRIKDAWKITNGVNAISLDGLHGLDATINGVSTEKLDTPYVFPGTYEIAIASKYFSIDGDSTFTVVTSDDAYAFYDVKAVLNAAGVAAYRSLVRASVEACVAMKTLATPCGMDITGINLSGATAVEGTVTRTLTTEGSAALDALQPQSGNWPMVVSSYDSISVDMTLQGSDGNTYKVLSGGYLDTLKVDFAAADPKVEWVR